ncbi:MAG: hypothetical protein KF729_18265 [Sandaracinaceae bacterium]|nr:hypothetical protein [Sandaracinaceae bacterium]
MIGRIGALALIALAGCAVPDLDLEGRRCPCVEGWVCDVARDVCVPVGGVADAGTRDGGATDGGATDGGATDGGAMDGGAMEAGTDAGALDAGDDAGADAASLDAGSDAAAPDAGPPPPPSLCGTTHASREFCDGFDTGDLSRWTRSDTGVGGTVRAVTEPVYRGTHAMRFDCPRGCQWASAAVGRYGSGRTLPSDLWLRAYFYFPSTHPPSLELIQIGDDEGHQTVVGSVWNASVVNWHAHNYLGGAYHDVMYAIGFDRWVCVELHVSRDATEGGAELFVEGVRRHGELTLDGRGDPMRRLDTFFVGVIYKDPTDEAQLVYVDEVVVDGARVGCDP